MTKIKSLEQSKLKNNVDESITNNSISKVSFVTAREHMTSSLATDYSKAGPSGLPKTKTKNDSFWSDDESFSTFVSRKTPNSTASSNDAVSSLNNANCSASSSKTTSLFDLLRNDLEYCPICLKKNTLEAASFVQHLKSCSARNNVKTEKLLEAISLQQRQMSERNALGLPAILKDKPNVRKPHTRRQGQMDVNLELGIALSTSLRESEFQTKLKETETLLEAGLEQEALSQCKQLEHFGFVSSKSAVEASTSKGASRLKNIQNTVLFTRSQEERERILTEKIASILIDSEEQTVVPITDWTGREIKSQLLKTILNEESTLWKKSYQSDLLAENEYYVESLSKFMSQCEVDIGTKLRNLSQIPGKHDSPEKPRFANNLKALAEIFEFKTEAIPTIENYSENRIANCSPPQTNSLDPKLPSDWKSLLNNKAMSDLTVYCKFEKSIYAHKLVLYVRCRSILIDTIKETTSTGKCNEIVMWMEYSFEAAIVFLEFLYTGMIPNVKKLDGIQKSELKDLCKRYGFIELKKQIENYCEPVEMFAVVENQEEKAPECSTSRSFVPVDDKSMTEGEKNLELLQMALATQNLSAADAPASPEMFAADEETDSIDKKQLDEDAETMSIVDSMSTVSNIDSGDEQVKCRSNISECSTVSIIKDEPSDSESLKGLENRLNGSFKPETSFSTIESRNVTIHSDGDDFKILPPSVDDSIGSTTLNSAKSEKRKSTSFEVKNKMKRRKSDVKAGSVSSEDDSELLTRRPKRKFDKKESIPYSLSSSESEKTDEAEEKIWSKTENRVEDSWFEADDFCRAVPDDQLRSSYLPSTVDKPKASADGETSPYISPVWNGFNDCNEVLSYYMNSPTNTAALSPEAATSHANKGESSKSTGRCDSNENRKFDDFTFNSFSIDESVLNKIESERKSSLKMNAEVKTPENVKKLKCRSKSDTFATPSPRNRRNMTPMADYSAMKSSELKKELDKYGLKPGLSRNTAKRLLRYIYDQLHPHVDELEEPQIESSSKNEKIPKKNGKTGASRSQTMHVNDSDSNDSNCSGRRGIGNLEESFVAEEANEQLTPTEPR